MDTQTARLETRADQLHWIDGLLEVIEVIVDTFIGMSAGTIVGWLFGLCAGRFYVRHWQPVYASAYSSLSEISAWTWKPSIMADEGAYIGAAIGAIIVLVIWGILWCQKDHISRRSRLHMK